MTIDPCSDTHLYAQLAALLQARSAAGEFGHLDALPSEPSLAQQYEVGRDTVRRAMVELRNEGLIFRIPHRGSFVGPRPS